MDMDVHGPGSDIARCVPGEGDQLAASERSAGIAGQGGKELEFPRAEVDRPPVMSKAASDDIQVEAVGHGQICPGGEWRAATLPDISWLDVGHRPIVGLDR
jgi:hypothetical protein